MMSLRLVRPHFPLSTPIKPKSLLPLLSSTTPPRIFFSTKPQTPTLKMNQIIEHIVLFKVKPETDPSKTTTMLTNLSSLISLDQVLHLSAGPILRNRSSTTSPTFTHILHSRYQTKDHLAAYSAHPDHVSVVKQSVLPICDDIMAVDWVFPHLEEDQVVLQSGLAVRVQFLKLKEGVEQGNKRDVLEVIGGIKEKFGSVKQISFGENFSPGRAKGFSIASLAVFDGVSELDGLDGKEEEEKVKGEKDRVRELLDGIIVVDYVVPPATSANL